MSLYVVATPIGDSKDITRRAIEILESSSVVIGEDFKNTSKLLKFSGLEQKEIFELSEHSTSKDIDELVELARTSEVALVSDCGTPGFCDPGADLVKRCRLKGIAVHSVPGPSSLMAFLSISGHRLDQFQFRGFLPAENLARQKELSKIATAQLPVILMDTPYRLKKLLGELSEVVPKRNLVLGLDLSTSGERVFEGYAADLLKLIPDKAEFMLCVLPIASPRPGKQRHFPLARS